MTELHIVGVDLAKRVFHVHGSDVSGHVVFRKKLSRPQFEAFLVNGGVKSGHVAEQKSASLGVTGALANALPI